MKKILIVLSLLLPSFLMSQNIVINEVMSSNHITIDDEDGDASDWIEIFNKGTEPVDLSGYYLSDDSLEINKWQFEETVIEAQEYLLIFASDKDKNDRHTNFKISASGEEVVLSDATGKIVDLIFVPASESDVSYGRSSDGANTWIFQEPTPGTENSGEAILDYSDAVLASVSGGFYQSPVTVELTAGNAKIYYTIDGSDPDSTAMEYLSPIEISDITVIRAVSYKENHRPSLIMYETYFIGVESDLPVVSLISDPYNLFDHNYGIYADGPGWTPNAPHHGANFWKDWERPAHVQFFDDNKNLGFSEDCCLEIYGAYTRSFAQKSFSVKFKDPYNSSALEYKLFPDFDLEVFKAFILRNSGNDFQYTHFRDAMQQLLIRDLDIDYLEYRPAVTYINGEYWGIYNIREKINEHYIGNRHGVDPDNIDMLEGNMEVIHGDTEHYAQLVDFLSNNDMNTEEAYELINNYIDLDNCLLYWAAQAYYNNQDWPANNVKIWRERSTAGKWRWILYDLDFGYNLYETTGQSEDHIYYIFSGVETRPGSNPPWSTLVPRKLVENDRIKIQFINLMADLLNTNFKSEKVVSLIDQMAAHIAGDSPKHREKWGIWDWTYNDHINRMKNFANERPGYIRGFMDDFFQCGSESKLTISATEGGKVKLNTLTLESDKMPWSGSYFLNVPVELTAIPAKGYKFDGWSQASTSVEKNITLSLSRSTRIMANFSPDTSEVMAVVINEINYNSADDFESGDWVELYNPSEESVDISNWYFSDSDQSHKYFFENDKILAPGEYLVVVADAAAFKACFPGVNNFVGETGFGLSGSGEFIKLVDNYGEIVDSLTYDDKSPWPEDADGDGATLELIDPENDNSLAESWRASDNHGTPGEKNSVTTGIDQETGKSIPTEFFLSQNYPNPFNPVTTIQYLVPKNSYVTLKVYDLTGKEVATLLEKNCTAGKYRALFDGSELSSGIYFYILKAGGSAYTQKMILLK